MLLIIDNYDSFTYNLVQYFGQLGEKVRVYRNDRITPKRIEKINPAYIVISPGPCTPKEAGNSCEIIRKFAGKIPLLGVCLGHQCIGYAFGAVIGRAPVLMHGKTSAIRHDGKGVFRGLPDPFTATRYHSLVIEEKSMPLEFSVTARSEDNQIMGIRHRRWPVEGVQFHPESVLTECGLRLLDNFLRRRRR